MMAKSLIQHFIQILKETVLTWANASYGEHQLMGVDSREYSVMLARRPLPR